MRPAGLSSPLCLGEEESETESTDAHLGPSTAPTALDMVF